MKKSYGDVVEALKSTTVHLIAAKSLAEENQRLLAPSKKDPFHSTRMKDFQKAIDEGRAALGWANES